MLSGLLKEPQKHRIWFETVSVRINQDSICTKWRQPLELNFVRKAGLHCKLYEKAEFRSPLQICTKWRQPIELYIVWKAVIQIYTVKLYEKQDSNVHRSLKRRQSSQIHEIVRLDAEIVRRHKSVPLYKCD